MPVDIDLDRLHRMGMVTPRHARSGPAEDFRIIKQPLLRHVAAAAAEGHASANLLIVTSAIPGEGKTFCAVNLAMSLAMEQDHTVLLVDAHVARPSVLPVLGLAPAPGLLDLLLSDTLAPEDVILRTNIPTLSLLSAGRSSEQATELLASQAMAALLADIASRDRQRIVIFDAPPVLPGSQACVLAGQMGHVVMVVAADSTSQRQVGAALRRLGNSIRIELICNKARALSGSRHDDAA